MDEGPRRLPKLVHLGGLLLGQDLRVQTERRRAGQLALLLVLPGLQGVLECLGHGNRRYKPPTALERPGASNVDSDEWDSSRLTVGRERKVFPTLGRSNGPRSYHHAGLILVSKV